MGRYGSEKVITQEYKYTRKYKAFKANISMNQSYLTIGNILFLPLIKLNLFFLDTVIYIYIYICFSILSYDMIQI